ncbi:MAG TPA: lipid-A-disaccharide synthase [Bryobacteraceae bacterium]|nr:lipid-A-disaccharide synthase [Bryobacteraceae bacterium]
MQFLVSAGEASGDMYAAPVVSRLLELHPSARFYGCAGPKLQALGVDPIIDAASLSIVGLAEVIGHLPGIYRDYRKLVRFARQHPPLAAILTDNPDFNLRLARQLKRLGVPVYYLVAPQVWAWRPGRVKVIRELVDKLFCLFPFEEAWFRERGVNATYIGHPLAAMVRTRLSREEFFVRHGLQDDAKTIVLLPGSRSVEIRRHLPVLLETVAILRRQFALNVLLATPEGSHSHNVVTNFREPLRTLSIQVIENETWDCVGHADLALAASGTVTIEAAVLGTPMVTFYKVNPLSWWAGRRLVKVPFLSMVNLIADRPIVPELMQRDMTPVRLAASVQELLAQPERASRMRSDLLRVRAALTRDGDPLRRTADLIAESLPVSGTLAGASASASGSQLVQGIGRQ